jgi:hypothetical protein
VTERHGRCLLRRASAPRHGLALKQVLSNEGQQGACARVCPPLPRRSRASTGFSGGDLESWQAQLTSNRCAHGRATSQAQQAYSLVRKRSRSGCNFTVRNSVKPARSTQVKPARSTQQLRDRNRATVLTRIKGSSYYPRGGPIRITEGCASACLAPAMARSATAARRYQCPGHAQELGVGSGLGWRRFPRLFGSIGTCAIRTYLAGS